MRAFGITPYVVPADMEGLPWSAGALLYVRQEQPETRSRGDTIAYVTDSDLSRWRGASSVPVDTERRFFYVEEPVYWDNVLGPCGGHRWLGYVSGYISRPPGLYLVLGVLWCWRCCASSPCGAERGENGRIPHREMYGNMREESSHRIGAGCGHGGGSPHLDGKACVCGGVF